MRIRAAFRRSRVAAAVERARSAAPAELEGAQSSAAAAAALAAPWRPLGEQSSSSLLVLPPAGTR